LPYYDNDADIASFREHAEKLVAAELKKGAKQPQSLPELPSLDNLLNEHPLLRAELERVKNREELRAFDETRLQLPAPSKTGTEDEWKAALDNAKAQRQHQRIRLSNLALLQTYGSNAWKIHNKTLEHDAKAQEARLEEMKERTVALNRERKQYQTEAGKKLTAYETRWTELISSTFQLELANFALETEIEQLKEREKELLAM